MKLIKALAGISAISSAAIWAFVKTKPKNIEELLVWHGYVLASAANNDDVWKSILAEKEQIAKTSGAITSEVESEKIGQIKDWCLSVLKLQINEKNLQNYWRTSQDLCIDSPKTIKGKLVRQGFSLDQTEEDRKISGMIFQRKINSEANDEVQRVKEFCDKNLKKSWTNKKMLSLSAAICSTQPKTLRERLAKNGFHIDLSKETTNNWISRHKYFAEDPKYKSLLNSITLASNAVEEESLQSITEEEKQGYQKIKQFCTVDINKQLKDMDRDSFFRDFMRVKKFCLIPTKFVEALTGTSSDPKEKAKAQKIKKILDWQKKNGECQVLWVWKYYANQIKNIFDPNWNENNLDHFYNSLVRDSKNAAACRSAGSEGIVKMYRAGGNEWVLDLRHWPSRVINSVKRDMSNTLE